jgi:type III secretion protein V
VVLLTSLDIRRFLRGSIVRNDLDIPVLSFQDIAPDYVVRPIATIGVKAEDTATPVQGPQPLAKSTAAA